MRKTARKMTDAVKTKTGLRKKEDRAIMSLKGRNPAVAEGNTRERKLRCEIALGR